MLPVLVLDGTERSALAIVRSIGRRNIRVRVGSRSHPCLASASRHCAATVVHRDPYIDPDGFREDILAASPPDCGEWILPCTDATTMLLVSDPRFANRLFAPSAESYETLTDKARLLRWATEAGILVPETVIVRAPDEVRPAAESVGRPIVVKPSRSKYLHQGRIRSTAVSIAETPDEAHRVLDASDWFPAIPALVQRFVPGTGAGVFALFWDGMPVCWFSHRRLLERPPWGGVSVLSESSEVVPSLSKPAARLLLGAAWSGLAMIEYRVTADGTPYLMEVNGRPWGSLQLAVDCGVDFPWLYYCCAQGLPFDRPNGYSPGRRLHWTLGDLDRLLQLLRGRPLAHQSTSRLHHLSAFAATTLRHLHRSEVLRLSDPGPGIFEVLLWLSDLRRSRALGVGARHSA